MSVSTYCLAILWGIFDFCILYRLTREVIRDALDSFIEVEWVCLYRVFYFGAVIPAAAS